MKFSLTYDNPHDVDEWNNLCLQCDNFVQTTHNDRAQVYYKQQPIYFQLMDDSGILVAGSKFYLTQNRKKFLKHLNKDLLQFGELIFQEEKNLGSYKQALLTHLLEFLKKEKVVTYVCANFYGNPDLLLKLGQKPSKQSAFNIARVKLKEVDLLPSFNRNTRRNIKKAEESNLRTTYSQNDIEHFLPFLHEIYEQQGNLAGCPNLDYVREMHKNTPEQVALTYCYDHQKLLSAVLCMNFGVSSYSVFGGTLKNELGSGQFMYYSLMQKLKQEGFDYYYFGQIAKEGDKENEKFSTGISTFKRGFSCEEIHAEKCIYILKPLHQSLWNLLVKIFVR